MTYKVIDENKQAVDSSEYRSIAISLADCKAKETGKVFRVQEPTGEVTYTAGKRVYSNGVKWLEVKDWPSGNKRVVAIFKVESTNEGERVSRTTIDEFRRESKPKLTAYARKCAIVTGDDGKTYIAELQLDDCISIMQSNLKFKEEMIWWDSSPDRFAAVLALIEGLAPSNA